MSRSGLLRLALFPLLVYGLVVLGMAGLQRGILFPAPRVERAVLDALAADRGAQVVEVRTEDGERLYGWRQGQGPVLVLYFSGNGASVGGDPDRAARLVQAGAAVLHVNYRGYPGSTGSPSEEGLRADARAAWQEARRSHAAQDVVIMGKSLGGGVAIGLAAELSRRGEPPRALVVESSFRSVVDVAAEHYGWLPVRRLVRDRFDSLALAPAVACPSLVVHGAEDTLIDVQHGRDLAVVLPGARLVEVQGAGHNDLLLADAAAWAALREVAGLSPRGAPPAAPGG